jgi:hypothetical protein
VTWSWLAWWRPPCLLRVVIVNLIDEPDTALKGVLWRSRGPWLVLQDVAMMKSGVPPVVVDGHVLVHRQNVAFIQVLP